MYSPPLLEPEANADANKHADDMNEAKCNKHSQNQINYADTPE